MRQETTSSLPIYQTIKEVAEHSGLSTYYLREGCKAGKIPHIKPNGTNGKYLINYPKLMGMLENEEV